jgi:DNA-binding transcriptional LysR family regulator
MALYRQRGAGRSDSLSGSFKSDSGDVLCQAALESVGIAILSVFSVSEHLEKQCLQQLLPNYLTWPERDIHAVFQPNRFQSTRLRLFVGHLAETCKKPPWE